MPAAPPLRVLQGAEARYGAWMDNLEYALEYNQEHTSHWVSTRAV